MIKRELSKDPKLAEESWDRFLPKFRQRHLKTSEKTSRKNDKIGEKNEARKAAGLEPQPQDGQMNKKEKKVYTPFPPAQQPRKVRFSRTSLDNMLIGNYIGRLAIGVWRVFPQAAREGGEGDCSQERKGATDNCPGISANSDVHSKRKLQKNDAQSVLKPSLHPSKRRHRQLRKSRNESEDTRTRTKTRRRKARRKGRRRRQKRRWRWMQRSNIDYLLA